MKAPVALTLLLGTLIVAPRAGVAQDAKRPACAIVGDGIAATLVEKMPDCAADAADGRSLAEVAAHVPAADVVIISAGHRGGATDKNLDADLKAIRAAAVGKVIWILPVDPGVRAAVEAVAAANGDARVGFTPPRKSKTAQAGPGAYDNGRLADDQAATNLAGIIRAVMKTL